LNENSITAENEFISKSANAFRTISEASTELGLPQHVLRFWESKFNQIKPLKRGGNRRYYRPEDLEILKKIRSLLYEEGYTIKGVQRLFKEKNLKTDQTKYQNPILKAKKIKKNLNKSSILSEVIDELESCKDILDSNSKTKI
jgi:Predicted transcriptional regulators